MAYQFRRDRGDTFSDRRDPRHKSRAELIFTDIRIDYARKPIGEGAYGIVRYARCDTLLCAAKLVHAVFFDDPNFEVLKKDFEDECELMSSMRHPNVIQYLGFYEEPRTRLPVLLMELMTCSLTGYLKNLGHPVSYHIAINFCHDIALGLSYLHSNNMMHRDLSSNNVLLLGEERAKITDFGQSKLADPEKNFKIKDDPCPGTQVYMPPEALRDPPDYSSMLDTFSFGVLMIQILSRNFPDPSPPTRYVPGVGKLPVKEAERRHNDIAKIDPKHHVLQLALYCINDDEERRPLMFELCSRFEELKSFPEYDESVRKTPAAAAAAKSRPDPSQDLRVAELTEQLKQLQTFMDNQETDLMQVRITLEKKDAQIKALQGDNSSRSAGRMSASSAAPTLSPSNPPPSYNRPEPATHTSLPPSFSRPESSLNNTNSLPNKQSSQATATKPTSLPAAAPLDIPDLTLSGQKKMRWYPCTRMPVPMYGGSAVMFHKRAYFNGQGQNTVYEYNPDRNSWSQLPPTHTASFTLVVVDQMLTAVGGYTPQNFTNSLFSLMEDKGQKVWMQTLPFMKEARVSPGAASTSTHLVVAGGEVQAPRSRFLAYTVEVLDIKKRQWSSAARLPKPVKRVTMTVCDDHFFVIGGVTSNNQPLAEIFYCSVSSLISTSGQNELSRALRGSADSSTWKIAGTPLVYSSCAAVGSNLLAIGGWDTKASNGVYLLNPRAPVGVNPWSYAGQLAVPRFDCMVTVLPGDRMIVIGGRGQYQDTVLNLAEMAVPI